MSREHVYEHSGYLWDMQVIDLMRKGARKSSSPVLPEFMDHAVSEVKAGSLGVDALRTSTCRTTRPRFMATGR
jgi:hypothetical protein